MSLYYLQKKMRIVEQQYLSKSWNSWINQLLSAAGYKLPLFPFPSCELQNPAHLQLLEV